jgi:Peptidase inhibitor I78 family
MKLVFSPKIAAGLAAIVVSLCAGCAAIASDSGPVVTDPVQPPPIQSPGPNTPTCQAQDLQSLVGQPRSVLETMRFGNVVRILEPGAIVTQDYSPTRLNIHLDANGVIVRVVCG